MKIDLVGTIAYDENDLMVIAYGEKTRPYEWSFDLVNRKSATTIHLYGVLAQAFTHRKLEWEVVPPPQEEVEDFIKGFMQLATQPLVMH